MDDHTFVRGHYEGISRHCAHLLQSAADIKLLARARESKQLAESELEKLNAQLHSRLPKTHA